VSKTSVWQSFPVWVMVCMVGVLEIS